MNNLNLEELYLALLDDPDDNIIVIDEDYRVIFFTKTIQSYFVKNKRSEISNGDDIREYIIHSNIDDFISGFEKAKNGEIIFLESKIKFDEKLNWFEHKLNPIYNRDGKLLGIAFASTNIDKQKRAEEALIDSESKYNKIFDRAQVLISITEYETGKYIEVNDFSFTFSGYLREEVIGKRSTDIGWISPEHRKLMIDSLEQYGKIDGLELPFKIKDGTIVYGIVNGEKINLGGNDYLLTITTDITQRKKAEQALLESETLYSNIFEYSPIGLQFYLPDGLLVKFNSACQDIFGVVDINDVKDWNLFNDPNVSDEKKDALRRGETIRYILDFDFDLVKRLNLYRTTKSGIRNFDVSLSSMSMGYIAQIVDITERMQAENDLLIEKARAEASEKRLANAIGATLDAIWEWDLNTNKTLYSPRWFEMLGYENNAFEMTFESWKNLCHPDDYEPTIEIVNDTLKVPQSYAAEFRMKTKSGEWKWILSRGNVVQTDENGKPVLMSGTNTDISENKKTAFELEQYRNHLELLVKEKTEEIAATSEEIRSTNEALHLKNEIIQEQNIELSKALEHIKETQTQLFQAEKLASLGVLTAGVAHEINNPLNYIMGAYEGLSVVLDERMLKENENIPVLLNILKEGVDRVSKIVNGLNQFSRTTQTINERCEIQHIIDNCLVILNKQYRDRIEVFKNYPDDIVVVTGNVGKLHQAFTNILSNAIQSIENHGSISIVLKPENKNAIIEIEDTGFGISNENLSKITEPFFTTKEPGKGTGLGLSITYSIVTELKGTMKFKSEVKKGTIVIITLPIAV